jgi:hypothetical protein
VTSHNGSPDDSNHLPVVHDKDMQHLHSRLGLFSAQTASPNRASKVGVSSSQAQDEIEMEYTGHLKK